MTNHWIVAGYSNLLTAHASPFSISYRISKMTADEFAKVAEDLTTTNGVCRIWRGG